VKTPDELEPLPRSEWDRRKARHLLERAGFGVPIQEVERLTSIGPEAAVAHFVDYEKLPDAGAKVDGLQLPSAVRLRIGEINRMSAANLGGREATEAERRAIEQQRQQARNAANRKEREDLGRLKAWWLERMLTTSRPLEEKMTLFWHGHFATSAQKVNSAWQNHQLNEIFRRGAAGDFRKLTREVGQSPAMLNYLDQAVSNRNRPNENWARELMELFTMGVGNYTEADIKNSARSFTGWGTDGEKFIFRRPRHDPGDKTFLGRTGAFNGDDILNIIFDRPVSAEFISAKLWRHLAYADPEPQVVKSLAETLRGENYEIKPLLARIFRSRGFYGDRAIGTQIKSPAQLVVGMVSHLDLRLDDPTEEYILNAMRRMGQDLFYPPNVKGWDGGEAWINPDTLITRYNLANFLVQGVVTGDTGRRGLQNMLNRRQMQQQQNVRQRRLGRNVQRTMSDIPAMDARIGLVGASDGAKGIKLAGAPFDAIEFFGRASGARALDVADLLADYFYGRPLRDDQRRNVVESLTGQWAPDRPLSPESWDIERLYGAVHLMLSAAEYQLC
jgi:uncharacterized protein (DUF1800 family)